MHLLYLVKFVLVELRLAPGNHLPKLPDVTLVHSFTTQLHRRPAHTKFPGNRYIVITGQRSPTSYGSATPPAAKCLGQAPTGPVASALQAAT